MNDELKPLAPIEQRLPDAHPAIFTFLDAWRDMRGGRLVPYKRDFDPARVRGLLASIFLYRFDRERDDFVCHLAGEQINQAWGRSIRGLTLREIVGDNDYPIVIERWREIIGRPLVHYGSEQERLSRLDKRRAERLLLPLAADDGRIDHVIGVALYTIGLANLQRSPLILSDITQLPCDEL